MASLKRAVQSIVERLEPQSLDGIRGQEELVATLRKLLATSRRRDHPLPPLLLIGPEGVGKMSIARATAREFMGSKLATIRTLEAQRVSDARELVDHLLTLRSDDILIVKQIEDLRPSLYEGLLNAARNFRLEFPSRQEGQRPHRRLPLPLFSLIATTCDEVSPEVIQDWLTARVLPYQQEGLAQMVTWAGLQLGISITDEAARELVAASQGHPRRLCELLAALYLEYAEALGSDERWLVDAAMVEEFIG